MSMWSPSQQASSHPSNVLIAMQVHLSALTILAIDLENTPTLFVEVDQNK